MSIKKIIFIHLLNDYSGSPKILSQVIDSIKKEDYDIALYTGKSEEGFLSTSTDNHYFYFYKRFENKFFTLATFMLSQVHLFVKLLKYRNDNVLFYVNTMLPFGAGLAGKIMNKPVIYHIHETSLKPASFKFFLRFIVKTSANKVLFVSNSLKNRESFKMIPQKVIYNALPITFIKMAEKNNYKPLKNGYFNVLMVCSLKEYKGVNEYIHISQQCQHHSKIKFTLILNAQQTELDEYFKKIKLPQNITLLTQQTNLIPFYQNTSLLLNLSRIDQWVETFGLTIIEAMAFGIPVIVPPVGGPTEIVEDEKEGFLISSYEIEKISKLIQQLSTNEIQCLKLSKNAREKSKQFDTLNFEKNITTNISAIV